MAKKIIAALALVIMGFFVAPLAANAAYGGNNATFTGSFTAGGTVNIQFPAGSFNGDTSASVTVSGNGTVTIGAFKADTAQKTVPVAADGSATASVKLPSNASGTYNVTGTGIPSGTVVTGSFSVGNGSTGGGTSTGASSGSGLADTGSTVSILAFWVAGGVVLLGAAFVAVRVVVRRQSRVNA